MQQARVVREIPVTIRPNMRSLVEKERVCFYARVSTMNDEQEDSFETQKEKFETMIKANPSWKYVGGYADQGITGTRSDLRENFLRMIEDCRNHKIDRILVKSISRFGRNTVDTLTYIRELKELGIAVYFDNEKIDTLTTGGEVLITILAAMAEQESRTMSSNIKWSYQKRFKDGRTILMCSSMLGYIKNKETGDYEIVESEAEIVRRIFREFVSGRSIRQMCDALNGEGIKTKSGKPFRPSSIEGILKNEKYTGNSILGKTYKPDVLTKRRLTNEGQAPKYYAENTHPGIITQELYDMAQVEKKRRTELRSSVNTGKGKYSSKYPLSGLLICAECGSKFRRHARPLASKENVDIWVCVNHQKNINSCKMKPIKEADIIDAYKRVCNRLSGDLKDVVDIVKESIGNELNNSKIEDLTHLDGELDKLRNKVLKLFRKKSNNEISKDEYDKKYEELCSKIKSLETEAESIKNKNSITQINAERYKEIMEVLNNDSIDYTTPEIMKKLISEIKVSNKHTLEFMFACGVTITEKI